MPQKGAIAVNGKDGLQLLNLRTGEVEWRQEELRGGIGEIFHDPINDILIAIRVSGSELKNILSRPEVQALNADTGDLLWNIKYNGDFIPNRSEEHTSELQSRGHLVCRLLLEKKKHK